MSLRCTVDELTSLLQVLQSKIDTNKEELLSLTTADDLDDERVQPLIKALHRYRNEANRIMEVLDVLRREDIILAENE